MKFSANLGFLWKNLPLVEAIHSAHRAGFDAVECHWPYDEPAVDVRQALDATGLQMLGVNTIRGNTEIGEMGLAALPDSKERARTAIDQAIAYADEIDALNIHVMAGIANGRDAEKTFSENLIYACSMTNRTILIEPLNPYDAPGYFLHSVNQAIEIIEALDCPNLRLMFDCYHVERIEGSTISALEKSMPFIGHIQFASVPDRKSPDQGSLDYSKVFAAVHRLGYREPIGAEYRCDEGTENTLHWLEEKRFHPD